MVSAVRLRRPDVVLWFPTFAFIRAVNCFGGFDRSGPKSSAGDRCTWFTPQRYEHADDRPATKHEAQETSVRNFICPPHHALRADQFRPNRESTAPTPDNAAGFVLEFDGQRRSAGPESPVARGSPREFTPWRRASWFASPFVSVSFTADTAGYDWNNKHSMTIGASCSDGSAAACAAGRNRFDVRAGPEQW